MDKIIGKARELGVLIQENEDYIKMQAAQQASDDDEKLQDLIGEFNMKRIALNREMQAAEKDEDSLKELETEVRKIYVELMANENMMAYQEARNAFDTILNNVMTIISKSAEGEDPMEIDPEAESGCGGSCSSCSGC